MPADEFEQNVVHSSSFPRRTRSDGEYRKRRPRLYRGSNNLADFLSDDSSSEFTADKGHFPTTFHYYHVGHHDAYAEEPETKLTIIRFTVRRIVEHILFRLFTLILILGDIVIVIISVFHEDSIPIYDTINTVLVSYFMLEVIAVIFGTRWKYYKRSCINLMDCYIVMLSFIFIIVLIYVTIVGPNFYLLQMIVIGRLVRLVRLFRVLRLYTEKGTIAKATRKYVSHNKRRYQKDGFDLDLCYVTERVIAMSIPSTGLMACYRNPVREVARFLDTKHKNHYKVYNLCSEKAYDENFFSGPVQRIFIDDHNVPKFYDIIKFANDVTRWMNAHPENVIAVHCKGGKGRTGLMICVWLVHSREFGEAQASLDYFGNRRTDQRFGQKFQGVQTPSQSRYVGYFNLVWNVFNGRMPRTKRLVLNRMNIVRVSGIGKGNGTDLWCRLNVEGEKFDIKFGTGLNCKTAFDTIRRSLIVKVFNSPILEDDIKVMFFCTSKVPRGYDNCAFYCWFHTAFIENNRLWLPREELDNPHKPRTWQVYREGFGVDFYFNELMGLETVLAGTVAVEGLETVLSGTVAVEGLEKWWWNGGVETGTVVVDGGVEGLEKCWWNVVGKRREEELREEVGVKDSVKKKLLRSRLKWAGHVE
ncbi:Phosphatidylinositol 3,4,5-trisphosphate 3-phosphatase TPTE2 [Lamellibrachia satsuma]|nr:Phosphatidylinositol 3,4,5-trisphosphate 3-phosphatase TPTE2 [Lamellibrachia satsuma]